MARIGIVVKGTDRVTKVCPGEWPTTLAAKAEIVFLNERFPLAPRLERVVLTREEAS